MSHLPQLVAVGLSTSPSSSSSIFLPHRHAKSVDSWKRCSLITENSSLVLPSQFPRHRHGRATAGVQLHPGDNSHRNDGRAENVLSSFPSFQCSPSRDCYVLLGSSFLPIRFRNGSVLNIGFGNPSPVRQSHRCPRGCGLKANSGRCRRNARFLSGGFRERGFSGHNAAVENGNLLSRKSGPLARSVIAAAAAGSSTLPSRPPASGWSAAWANFVALCASFASRLEGIRIGWLDALTMVRILVLAAAAVGTFVASKVAWARFRDKTSKLAEGQGSGEGDEDEGIGANGGPMQVLARGATCLRSNMGPWSISDMTIGLTAIAKVTEKEPPPLPGKEVKDLPQDSNFLLRAQHWRALAEAVYAKDSASFSLFTSLPESSLVSAAWDPNHESFRPAYAVFVDAPYGAVVLSVRGTSHIVDMLLNTGASPEPFGDGEGYAHGGFVHATNVLCEEVLPHIEKAFKDHGGTQKELKLVIVGHSLGAAVGTLTALSLQKRFPELECWAFCPPACMSLDLATQCRTFTTSFVAAHDLVPRFSLHSVEKLRTRIENVDWDDVERVAKDDEDWQKIKGAMETFRGIQQARDDTMGKLMGAGDEDSEVGKKAKEATGLAKDIGNKANDYLEGKNDSDPSENGDNGDESGGACQPQPLYPPGRLLVMGSDPPGCGKMPEQRSDVAPQRNYGTYPTFDEVKNLTWRMFEAEQNDLEDIVVSPWCISDHMLGNMCEAISYFQSCCPPAVK